MSKSTTDKKIKLTPRQKDVIRKMHEGWVLIIGRSETTGSVFQQLSKGYDNEYFNAKVFSSLYSKALFTTEDGKDIFEDDPYWFVGEDFKSHSSTAHEVMASGQSPNRKYFSTEQVAQEYILLNKPVLSVKDVTEFIDKHLRGWIDSQNPDRLKQLAKSKINSTGGDK